MRSLLRSARSAVRDDPWSLVVASLVVLITCTPRIPLDIAIPGRTFDLRALDVALVVIMPFWLVRHIRRLRVIRLGRLVAVYLVVVTACTVIAVMTLPIAASRAASYLLKSWEYLAVFALVASTIQTSRGRLFVLASIAVTALLNVIWFGVQVASGENRLLWSAERPLSADVFVSPNRLYAYGPKLIAESSPLSIGALFMVASLVTLNLAVEAERAHTRAILLSAAALLFAAELLSQSRIMVAATLLGAVCVFAVSNGRRRMVVRSALIIGLAGVVLLAAASVEHGLAVQGPRPTETAGSAASAEAPPASTGPNTASSGAVEGIIEAARSGSIANRLDPGNIEYGLGQRLEIWGPIVHAIAQRPLLGYGKGGLGGYDSLAEEAHDQYLRELAEAGLPGLLTFLALLWAIARLALRNTRSSGSTAIVGRVLIAVTCGMAAAATLQDAFVPVIPGELFWLLVGLCASPPDRTHPHSSAHVFADVGQTATV